MSIFVISKGHRDLIFVFLLIPSLNTLLSEKILCMTSVLWIFCNLLYSPVVSIWSGLIVLWSVAAELLTLTIAIVKGTSEG